MLRDTIGLDLHKRETQVCILTADGELVERRIATIQARFTEVLGVARPLVFSLRRRPRASGSRAISRARTED
jgi:hypothetical protein